MSHLIVAIFDHPDFMFQLGNCLFQEGILFLEVLNYGPVLLLLDLVRETLVLLEAFELLFEMLVL